MSSYTVSRCLAVTRRTLNKRGTKGILSEDVLARKFEFMDLRLMHEKTRAVFTSVGARCSGGKCSGCLHQTGVSVYRSAPI